MAKKTAAKPGTGTATAPATEAAGTAAKPGTGTVAGADVKAAEDTKRAEAQRSDPPAPNNTPVPGQVAPFVPPALGKDVVLRFPADQLYEGVHTEAIGKVVKVLDEAAGTVNVKVFSPDGGADTFITGVRHVSKRDELAADSPERNLPVWDYLSDSASA